MKEIYWIDDNINNISLYIRGVIKELWGDENEKGISSNIRIFGTAYKEIEDEANWDINAIKRLKEEIQNNMRRHCIDLEAWDWGENDTIYKEKEKLIVNEPILVEMDAKKEVEEFIQKWSTLETGETKDWECKELTIEKIRSLFKIPEGASVAIDLVLLLEDKKKIEEEKAIISMLLFNKLSSNGHKCILYSTYMYDYFFINKWKDIYNKKRSTNELEVDKIYAGRDMWENAETDDIINKIKEIAEEVKDLTKGDETTEDVCGADTI